MEAKSSTRWFEYMGIVPVKKEDIETAAKLAVLAYDKVKFQGERLSEQAWIKNGEMRCSLFPLLQFDKDLILWCETFIDDLKSMTLGSYYDEPISVSTFHHRDFYWVVCQEDNQVITHFSELMVGKHYGVKLVV